MNFLCQAVVSLHCHAKWFRFVCRRTWAWNADWYRTTVDHSAMQSCTHCIVLASFWMKNTQMF